MTKIYDSYQTLRQTLIIIMKTPVLAKGAIA